MCSQDADLARDRQRRAAARATPLRGGRRCRRRAGRCSLASRGLRRERKRQAEILRSRVEPAAGCESRYSVTVYRSTAQRIRYITIYGVRYYAVRK